MSTALTSTTSVFEDALNLISISGGLPFVLSGDTVTAISTNGQTFTPVPTDGTSADVDGTYLSLAVTDTGNATASPFQSNQALVDQINANAGSTTPLSDTFYYQVMSASGLATYALTEDLGDVGLTTPDAAPYSMAQVVSVGSTVGIGGGLTVDKALSTGQTDNSADPLSVTIAVFDFGVQQPDGTLAVDPSTSGGGGTISTSPDGSSVTIDGTIAQINADLSTLAYTAVQTGTDSIIISETDDPTPTANQIIGNLTVQTAPAMMPVANSATTIFEVLPAGNGSGQGAPFFTTGDTIVGISSDDVNFTPVPTDGTQASVNGSYLTFSLDSSGNLSTSEYQVPQSLIDQINANDSAATPLTDNVYYQVEDGSGTITVDQYSFDLSDTSFGAPDTQPYSSPATVMQGTTIGIGGPTIEKALSSDGTYGGADPTAYSLSVAIGVFDFTHQAPDGTGAIDPTVAGGGGTVTYGANDGSVTIVGTINQINADLGTLTYTAVQTGTDFIDISVADGPVPGSDNQILGSIEIDPASAACYCRGVCVTTEDGERPVEDLAVGDHVITFSGHRRRIRWIGRRSYTGRLLAANPTLRPIRFCAGSLGDGLPRRDLRVSPEHSMFLDGILVPARCLVNGISIVQEHGLGRVDYFHVELDSHDVLLAEGAPSESFLDDNSRGMFHNAGEFAALYPQAPISGGFCAPKVDEGYELEAIRRRLADITDELAAAA